ncbi:MAG: hypothetical protein CL674_08890 [Bdellovibrionaceae bacterium]|nr:hypothetical protein [Pseudobdellovibrionaceae bacterium]|tara:strand:- start:11914 stop:12201 length:288 start_codon:yes stop_codon:yes gene_type:complete
MAIEVACFSCHYVNSFPERVALREECEKCGSDLHCCKCCKFYDTGSYNECRETSADVVRDKERSNHCDYFVANSNAGKDEEKDKMLSAAEALFKK